MTLFAGFKRTEVVVKNPLQGSYVKGEWATENPDPDPDPFMMVMLPLSPDDFKQQSEGEFSSKDRKFYLEGYAVAETGAEFKIIESGETFIIRSIDDRQNGKFCRYFGKLDKPLNRYQEEYGA